jgi:hypothetical protein
MRLANVDVLERKMWPAELPSCVRCGAVLLHQRRGASAAAAGLRNLCAGGHVSARVSRMQVKAGATVSVEACSLFLIAAALLGLSSCGAAAAGSDGGTSDAAHKPDATRGDSPVPDDCNPATPPPACSLGSACPNGGCCVAGFCVSPGERCARNLGLCTNESCGGCGALNEPCCVGHDLAYQLCLNTGDWQGPSCSDPNTGCTDAGKGERRCLPCGAEGEPCCTGGDVVGGLCNGWKLVCDTNGMCSANCDHVGQPCCIDGDCAGGSICMTYAGGPKTAAPTACIPGSACGEDAGVCTTCGVPGLPCCDGGCIGIGDCDPSGMCPIEHMR